MYAEGDSFGPRGQILGVNFPSTFFYFLSNAVFSRKMENNLDTLNLVIYQFQNGTLELPDDNDMH